MATGASERSANGGDVRYGACNLCEAICGLRYEIDGGRIVSIRGDEDDPLSRGHICPKALAMKDIHEDPDRLRRPQIREGSRWREADWPEALDLVARRLTEVQGAHGSNAVAAYLGNPNVHNIDSLTHAQQFLKPFGSRNRYSATSVDQLPHQLVAYWLYGHQFLVPIPDIDNTQLMLMFGANPLASNGSLMTVPGFRQRLAALQARGGRLVVFDPRRTETAQRADEHLFVRPGTDAAVLAALVRIVLDEQLLSAAKLAAPVDGLDQLAALFAPLDLERLADHGGVPLPRLRELAREFAGTERAVCYGRMGVSTQRYGTLCQWLIQVLNIITGKLDAVGGALFARPAVDLVHNPISRPGHFAAWRSRVRGLPEFGGELPVACLAEEIETPGEGQVRALITMAGNPVLSTPAGGRLAKALKTLDFMVSIDIYRNETTGLADVILPPTVSVEHDHYDLVFHHFAVRNTARYTAPLFDKPDGALHDWEILQALGERVCALLDKPFQPLPPPAGIIDAGLRSGPWREADGDRPALSLQALCAAPHGIDLGPLQPSLPERLYHQDRRIALIPEPMPAELRRLAEEAAEAPDGSLLLIGRRHLRSNNSWLHNSRRLVKGPQRHQLHMHPDDLRAAGLADGDRVVVRSAAGEVRTEVSLSEDMMPGVVSLPHGFGHGGSGQSVARELSGASANDLTDPQWLDGVSGNAALNGVPVTVSAA